MRPVRILHVLILTSFLTGFFNATSFVTGQSLNYVSAMDSIRMKADSIETDSARIIYYQKAWEVSKSISYDQAIDFADKGLLISRRAQDWQAVSTFLWQKGLCFQLSGNFDQAGMLYRQSMDVAQEHHLDEENVMAQHRLAEYYYRKGHMDSAQFYYGQSLSNSQQMDFKKGLMLTYSGLGKMEGRMGNYDSALVYFINAYSIAVEINMPSSQSHALMNMGIIYGKIGNYKLARSKSLQAVHIADSMGDVDRLQQLFNNLAVLYRKDGNYDTSLIYQNRSIVLAKKMNSINDITNSFMNFGTTYAFQKKYSEARTYYDSAYQLAKNTQNKPLLMSLIQNISAVSKDLGKYDESIQFAREALNMVKTTKQYNNLSDLYENMYVSYKSMGKVDSALKYHELFVLYHDSLFNERRQKNIDELQIRFETREKERDLLDMENKSLEQDLALANKRVQLNIVYGISFTTLVVTILIIVLISVRRRKDFEIHEKDIERLKKEKEVNAAIALITGQEKERKRIAREIHDGIGVLLSTATIHLTNNKVNTANEPEQLNRANQKAVDMIKQASTEIRRIAHNMMPGVLVNFGLFDALEDLFDEVEELGTLQVNYERAGLKSRFDENFEVTVYRLMQELVNNTLKHAEASSIDVEIQRTNHLLEIKYHDNGKGFDLDSSGQGSGIGLTSIISRVEFLNGKVHVYSFPGQGCRYHLVFPI